MDIKEKLVGDFIIYMDQKIGKGSYGAVYKAAHKVTKK